MVFVCDPIPIVPKEVSSHCQRKIVILFSSKWLLLIIELVVKYYSIGNFFSVDTPCLKTRLFLYRLNLSCYFFHISNYAFTHHKNSFSVKFYEEDNSNFLSNDFFPIFSSNSQELRDSFFSWTVKITVLCMYCAEESHRFRNWISFWLVLELYIFCGSRPFPRLVNSGSTV